MAVIIMALAAATTAINITKQAKNVATAEQMVIAPFILVMEQRERGQA